MARKADVSDRVVSAALEVAASCGWRSLSLAEIAEEAGVSLAEAYATHPTKASILADFIARTDRQVLAGGATEKMAGGIFSVARIDSFVVASKRNCGCRRGSG